MLNSKLIKILLLPLIIINFTLADVKPANIGFHNTKENSTKKIVLFEVDSQIGKQIANDLLKHKNYELHFTFSDEKALKSFSSYAKKQSCKHGWSNFKGYVYNPCNQKDSLPKSVLTGSTVILCLGGDKFFLNPDQSNSKIFKNYWTHGLIFGSVFSAVDMKKHSKKLNALKLQMRNSNWAMQKELLDKFKDAKHVILVFSSCGGMDARTWFRQDILSRQKKSAIYFDDLKVNYTIIHTPILTAREKPLSLRELALRVRNLTDTDILEGDSLKPHMHQLKLSRSDISYFINECLNKLYIIKNKSFDLVKRKDLNLPELQQNNLEGLLYELQGKKQKF